MEELKQEEQNVVEPGKEEQAVAVIEAKPTAISANVWADKDAFNQMLRVSQMLSQSSIVPQNYQGKPQDCFIAVELASRMNTSPVFIMQNLYVVKGKPSWSGQACTAMINASGKFANVKPVYTGKEHTDTWGCYLQAIRLADGEVVCGTEVTIKMAKDEGWYNKPDKYGKETSKWPTMPKQMLAYRAAAFFARVYCPESLMGLQTYEEVIDADQREKVSDLTATLKGE